MVSQASGSVRNPSCLSSLAIYDLTLMLPFWLLLTGQVVALFIVGTCEYAVVWLGTDWDHEVEKGVWRNNQEMMHEVTRTASEVNA